MIATLFGNNRNRILGISLCLISLPSFSGLLDTKPKLSTSDTALEDLDQINQKALSGLRISYNREVFLAYNPLLNQQETQFAAINQSAQETLRQYAARQNQAHNSDPQAAVLIRNFQQSVNTSTLSPELIELSREQQNTSQGNGIIVEYYSNADVHLAIENSTPAVKHVHNVSSERYLDTWSKIANSQDMHQDRWQRTLESKRSARSLGDMSNDKNIKARNNLFFKGSKKAKKSQKRDNYVERYPSPKNVPINPHAEDAWVYKVAPQLTKRMPNSHERELALRNIYREALNFDLKPDLVLALIQIESNFKPNAVSRVGAQGLMQVMPFWKNELGSMHDNLHDIQTNIRYGCTILRHYLNIENDKLIPALARYNGSYGRMKYPNKVIHAWLNHWQNL